jgi:hypothetical protein
MKKSTYKDLFEQVKKFKEEQEKQKHRGLNNYNILTTVLKEHDEVRLHSRMIASLLDPLGEHYQSTLFLDKFLEVLNTPNFSINTNNCSVYREYKNIDIYITDGNKHIIIENKVYAGDQKNQIERYIEIIEEENKKLEMNDILVVYLSLDRREPSSYSLGSLSIDNGRVQRVTKEIALFKSIHYKNEILKWLENCQYEVQNITNLNEVFRQYIDVVKMINHQYKDKIMSLSDYIIENKEVYKLAMELEKELPKVKKIIVDNFLNRIISLLRRELGEEWEIKFNQWKVLKIYKKNWINSTDYNIIFVFSFDDIEKYNEAHLGIIRNSAKVDIKNDIIKKFSLELNSLNYNRKTTQWWLHKEYLSNMNDFIEYIQFNKNAEKEFINGLMNLIKIFELDSNLMTEINSYLNDKE